MAEQLRILVDSCVWIDTYLGDHPRHDESLDFLRSAREADALLLYGASKLESIFYVLIAEVKRAVRAEKGTLGESDVAAIRSFAWGCVENIRSCATAVGVDEADIWLAEKYRSLCLDLEDNLVFAAAKRAQADYVVSWDQTLLGSPLAKTATPVEMSRILALPR